MSTAHAFEGLGTAISDGGALGNIELMLNMPFSDTFAARAVLYTDTKEGWIDNVSGTRTAESSATGNRLNADAGSGMAEATPGGVPAFQLPKTVFRSSIPTNPSPDGSPASASPRAAGPRLPS